jgi:CRISPR-associated protein Csx3
MTTFKIELISNVLKIGFNPEKPATNDVLVKDALAEISKIDVSGLPLLKISGPASLPVSMVIAHSVCHIVGAVAVFDPKLGQFVVCISHNPDHRIGDLL